MFRRSLVKKFFIKWRKRSGVMHLAVENRDSYVSITCDEQIKSSNQEKYSLFATRYFCCQYFSRLPARCRGPMMTLDDLQETAMRAIPFKRFVCWLMRVPPLGTASTGRTKSAATILEFDPLWHGDHWQNLLASPMDARHYVMEDWALPMEDDELDHGRTEDKNGGARRRMRS
jgi:hypothetical protein